MKIFLEKSLIWKEIIEHNYTYPNFVLETFKEAYSASSTLLPLNLCISLALLLQNTDVEASSFD